MQHNHHPTERRNGSRLTDAVIMDDINKRCKILSDACDPSSVLSEYKLEQKLMRIAFGLIQIDYLLKDIRPNEKRPFIKNVIEMRRTGSPQVDRVLRRISEILEELASLHSINLNLFAPEVFKEYQQKFKKCKLSNFTI